MKHGEAALKWHLYVVTHLFTFPVTALTLCWHSVAPYNLIHFTCPADRGKRMWLCCSSTLAWLSEVLARCWGQSQRRNKDCLVKGGNLPKLLDLPQKDIINNKRWFKLFLFHEDKSFHEYLSVCVELLLCLRLLSGFFLAQYVAEILCLPNVYFQLFLQQRHQKLTNKILWFRLVQEKQLWEQKSHWTPQDRQLLWPVKCGAKNILFRFLRLGFTSSTMSTKGC